MRNIVINALVLVVISAALILAIMLGRGSVDTQLMLYCGAGIRPAADALIEAFRAETGISVTATYAGSGQLLGQIASLQKGDIFMPGDALYVTKAIERELADTGTQKTVAYFVPVIFVQKGNPHKIATLRDLAKPGLRLGIGDERACAVGQQTLRILELNGIPYSDIEKNVACKTATVNELGTAIQLRTVDAVIVWNTTAQDCAAYGEIVHFAEDQNIISPIPVVVLKSSEHPAEAARFVGFVTSEKARRILKAIGYMVPTEELQRSAQGTQ